MHIDGKTALITGGASGLGAAAARMIVEAGGRAVVADLKPGDDAGAFIATDVISPDQVQAAIRFATERHGGLHILIACAGIAPPGRVVGKDGPMPLDQFPKVIGVN